MAANQYKRGELFRRYHLQNIDKRSVIEESSEEVDGALVESDNQADLPVLDEAEVVPVRTTKRKASSDENIGEFKSARKLSKKTPKVRAWAPKRVELLKYLKEYKITYDFNGKDFEQDLSAMYTEIPHAWRLISVMNSGLKAPLSLKKLWKKWSVRNIRTIRSGWTKNKFLLSRKGYNRVKEKIRNVRQDFRHPSAPGLHVKASFSWPRVGGVPHLPGVPPPPCGQALTLCRWLFVYLYTDFREIFAFCVSEK